MAINIPGYDKFAETEPIGDGLSRDKKYRVKDTGGRELLLRLSDIGIWEGR